MTTFSELFQLGAQFEGTVFDILALQEATENVSTAQFDTNSKKVDALVKSFIKDGNLWVAPTVAVLDDIYYLVSGRHRVEAIEQLCMNYCINNRGTVIKMDANNPEVYADFDRITSDSIICNVVTVQDKVGLNALIVAHNGSRSMTAAEKATTNIDAGKASALTTLKMAWSRRLRDAFPVNITQQTALQFAGSLFNKRGVTPDAERATPEQLEAVIAAFCGYIQAEEQAGTLTPTIARDYASVWADFIPTIMESFNAAIPAKVEKVVKAKALSKAEEMIAELQAQLMERNQALANAGIKC